MSERVSSEVREQIVRHLPCGLLSPPTTLHTQVASGWRWVLGPTLRVRSSEQVVRARAKECQRNAPAQTKSFKVPRDTPGLVALGVRDPGSLPCTLAPCSCRKWRATARPYDALTALRVFGSGCFAFLYVPDVCFTALPVLPHACCTYGIPEGHLECSDGSPCSMYAVRVSVAFDVRRCVACLRLRGPTIGALRLRART